MPGPSEEDDVFHKLATGMSHNEAIVADVFRRFNGEVKLRVFDERYQFRFRDLCIMIYRTSDNEAWMGEVPFSHYAHQAKVQLESHIIDEYIAGRL